ncbi:MAG: HAD-IA family hydrolase [Alphaproteobacteria bacterium]|nr:HAD-IA family hydrolase [Alphaproteobacteria bacterium]
MKVCLFDCGGVIYPYSLAPFKRWLSDKTSEKSFSFKWKELMTGEISFSSFSKDVCHQLKIDYTPNKEKEIFLSLCKGKGDFYSQTLDLISYLKAKNVQMGLLSNALPCFEGTLDSLPLTKEFIFPSYELGLLKPDKRIFQEVLKKMKVNPDEVLFIDDKKENVEVALSVGFKSFVFQKETALINLKKIMGEKDVGYIGRGRCHCR